MTGHSEAVNLQTGLSIVAFSETYLQSRLLNVLNYSAEWQNTVGFGEGVKIFIRKGIHYTI